MKNRYMKIITFIAAALLFADTAVAIELDMEPIGFPIEKIDVHGFVSQGYMVSSNNNIFGDSKSGSIDFRDFGINFSGNLTEDIRLAVQFAGYNLGGQGGDNLNLHYGYADYRLSDEIGFRLGRIRVPAGLYNETRDIDMLRSSVFMPQSIYPEVFREYYASNDAAAIYGGIDMNDMGFLSYQVYGGYLIDDEDPTADVPYMITGWGFENVRFPGARPTYGSQLVWDTPVDGLRFSHTWRRFDSIATVEMPTPGGPVPITLELDNYANQIWSAEYQTGKWTFASEYGYIRVNSQPEDTSWYTSVNYEVSDKLSVGSYYSVYAHERGGLNEADGVNGKARTLALFGKYNITYNWNVKAQIDFMHGTANNQNHSLSPNDKMDSILLSFKTGWSF